MLDRPPCFKIIKEIRRNSNFAVAGVAGFSLCFYANYVLDRNLCIHLVRDVCLIGNCSYNSY